MRACLDDLKHAAGVTESSWEYKGLLAWLMDQPADIRELAEEFTYGHVMLFNDARMYVVAYREDHSIGASPICPQCYGSEEAAADAGFVWLNSEALRECRRHRDH